jgi:hypothetical protein
MARKRRHAKRHRPNPAAARALRIWVAAPKKPRKGGVNQRSPSLLNPFRPTPPLPSRKGDVLPSAADISPESERCHQSARSRVRLPSPLSLPIKCAAREASGSTSSTPSTRGVGARGFSSDAGPRTPPLPHPLRSCSRSRLATPPLRSHGAAACKPEEIHVPRANAHHV